MNAIRHTLRACLLIVFLLFLVSDASAQTVYFPHVASDGMWETEICVVNANSSHTLSGTLRAYGDDGREISESRSVSLAPNGRYEIKVGSEFVQPQDIGYLTLETDASDLAGYTKFHIDGHYRVAVPAVTDNVAEKIYVPHVASNDDWWTGIGLVNTTDAARTLSFEFNNGISVSRTLPAKGHASFTINELFDGQAPSGLESAVITNAEGVVGLELFGSSETYLSGILLKGDRSTSLYYPHIASDANWWTGVVACNPNETAADLIIRPYAADGTPLTSQTMTLGASGKYIGTASLLNFPDRTAWFKIDSTEAVTGFELFGTNNGQQLAGYTGVNTAAQSGVFAKIETDGWSGIAFVNVEDAPAAITLTAYGNNGNAVATGSTTLNAHEKSVGVAQTFFAADITSATYIAYTSDQNIVGFQLNGSSDDMLLDALPGLAVASDETDGAGDGSDSGALVINEIVAKDADGGNDWIEFYVTEGTVALGDYTVVDDDPDHDVQALPDVSLSAGNFYTVEAIDEEDECPAGSSCVSFKLGSDDAVTLLKNGAQMDILDWMEGEADKGYSFGRLPDGTGTAQTLSPTKGTVNEAADDIENADPDNDTDNNTDNNTNDDADIDFFSQDTVEDVYITISDADWNDILTSPLLEEYHAASVTYQGVTLDNVAFRTKGNSSLSAVARMGGTRYSFKVDTNYYVDGQKLLGMKKFNLNNNYKDPSYMRERLAYDMMRSLEIPTPRLSYVNLYINGSLHGLYTLVEQVDSEFLEENFENPDGDLYKPDGAGSDLVWMGENFSAYSGVELKTNEDTSDNSAFLNMVYELNNGGDPASVVDVDEVLRYLAVSTALSNLDSYQGSLAHNYYIYEEDGVFSIIPWDFNESFGTFAMGCEGDGVLSLYIDEPTSGALADRPLIARLLENETYKATYHSYIQDLMDGVMDPDAVSATIADTKSLIAAHVQNDPTAFYSYAEFEASLGDGMVDGIYGLQGFVEDRTANMAAQLAGSAPIEGDGSGSCGSSGFVPNQGPGGMPPR